MKMQSILKTLMTVNNFAMLNVFGKVGNAKHYNISEAAKELGYKQVSIVTSSIGTDLDLSKYNDNDTKTVLILEDLDRASDSVTNVISKGIINRNLFNLDLKNVVVVVTTVDMLDSNNAWDSALLCRSVLIKNE